MVFVSLVAMLNMCRLMMVFVFRIFLPTFSFICRESGQNAGGAGIFISLNSHSCMHMLLLAVNDLIVVC